MTSMIGINTDISPKSGTVILPRVGTCTELALVPQIIWVMEAVKPEANMLSRFRQITWFT